MVLLWASAMFGFSTDTFSKDNTAHVIVPALQWLLPYVSYATIDFLHVYIRKSAHVFEYAMLSLLLFRAVRAPRAGWRLNWAATALILATAFAASDEIHQVFVPSRGPSIYDVMLDTAAAATMQCVIWLWLRRTMHTRAEAAPHFPHDTPAA